MNFLRKKRLHNAGNPKGFWGRKTLSSMNKEHDSLTNKGLSFIRFQPHFTCLDIGCGGGRTVGKLARNVDRGLVYGVDISDTSVKSTIKYNKKAVQTGKVIVQKGNVDRLPFGDGFFDVVTAVETFYFWKDKQQAVREVYRVMRPGGIFVIMLDAYRDGSNKMDEVVREIALELNAPEEIMTWLRNAGFDPVRTETDSDGRLYAVAEKNKG